MVTNAMLRLTDAPSSIANIVAGAVSHLHKFRSVQLCHVPRTGNKVAHTLAQFPSFPSFIWKFTLHTQKFQSIPLTKLKSDVNWGLHAGSVHQHHVSWFRGVNQRQFYFNTFYEWVFPFLALWVLWWGWKFIIQTGRLFIIIIIFL